MSAGGLGGRTVADAFGVRSLLWLAPAELESGDDPFAMFSGWESGQLLWLAILVPVAVLVFSVASRRTRSSLGSAGRGRDDRLTSGGPARDEAWRATVERLEQRVATPIASAQNGPVRVEGVIVGSTGNLGGAPGRECVWRNRSGAGPQTAVASELLIVRDASGRCGVEELEGARVVAPIDKAGANHESMSLHIGDRIEVIGSFERDVLGEDEDPTQLVYGTLGIDRRLDIRVLERPAAAPEAPPAPKPAAAPSEGAAPNDGAHSTEAPEPEAPEHEP